MYNLSYELHELTLAYEVNGQLDTVVELSDSDEHFYFTGAELQSLQDFAKKLGLDELELRIFAKFLTCLLSPMTQEKVFKKHSAIFEAFLPKDELAQD